MSGFAVPVAVLLLAAAFTGTAGAAPVTERASIGAENQEGDGASGDLGDLALAAGGSIVTFASAASNLVPGDDNGTHDVFVRDRKRATTTRLTTSGGSQPQVSADGRLVLFIANRGGRRRAVVHDRRTGVTRTLPFGRRSVPARPLVLVRAALSPDGRYVATVTGRRTGSGPAGQDLERVVLAVTDRRTGRFTRLLSRPFEDVGEIALSRGGRRVALATGARLVRGDRNRSGDVYAIDRRSGRRTRVSVSTGGRGGDRASAGVAISARGRFVAFTSEATNLVRGDTNREGDVFVRDLRAGRTWRASVGPDGTQLRDAAALPAISADGRRVAFHLTEGDAIGDVSGPIGDVLLYDRATRSAQYVSVDGAGVAVGRSGFPAISAGGRHVAFASASERLVAGDANGVSDVFVRGPF